MVTPPYTSSNPSKVTASAAAALTNSKLAFISAALTLSPALKTVSDPSAVERQLANIHIINVALCKYLISFSLYQDQSISSKIPSS